jgi:hypothetical protein
MHGEIIAGFIFFTFVSILAIQNTSAQEGSVNQSASDQILDSNSTTVQKGNLTSDFAYFEEPNLSIQSFF